MNEDKKEWVLWIQKDVDTYASGARDSYGHINIYFMVRHGETIRGSIDEYCEPKDQFYGGLRIRCQQDPRNLNPYGHQIEYHDMYTINLRSAERMLKTLKKINRGIDRLYAKFGPENSFSDYAVRIANICKIDTFVTQTNGTVNSFLSEREYRFMDIVIGKYTIEEFIEQNKKELEGVEA